MHPFWVFCHMTLLMLSSWGVCRWLMAHGVESQAVYWLIGMGTGAGVQGLIVSSALRHRQDRKGQ